MIVALILIWLVAVCYSENKDIYSLIGSSETLDCTGSGQVTWKGDDKVIPTKNTTKYSFYRSSMLIKNLQDDDFKVYLCGDDTFTLKKGSIPQLIKKFDDRNVVSGDSLMLKCEVESVPAMKVIDWKFNGKPVESDGNLRIESVIGVKNTITVNLKISKLTLQNNGNFSCYGSNGLGMFSHTSQINVYAAPSIIIPSVEKVGSRVVTLKFQRMDDSKENSELQKNVILSYTVTGESDEKSIVVNSTDDAFIHKFTNLKPFTEYTFSVFERVLTFDGKVTNITVETNQTAPTMPMNLEKESVTSTQVRLLWNEPLHLNGVIKEFKLEYFYAVNGEKNRVEKTTPNVANRIWTVNGLFPFIDYDFRVSEKTVDYGPYAQLSIKTLPDVPQGKPKSLTISKIGETEVQLSWDKIPDELKGGRNFTYLIDYKTVGESKHKKLKVENAETFKRLVDLSPYTEYEVTVKGINDQGPADNAAKETFTTLAGAPSEPRQVRVIPHLSSINVTWLRPAEMNGPPGFFKIFCEKSIDCSFTRCKRRKRRTFFHSFEENGSVPLDEVRSFLIMRPLDPYSLYHVQVQEKTKHGRWGQKSTPIDVITNQGRPSKPQNVTAVSVKDTSITITWLEPYSPNGILKSYNIITYFGMAVLKNEKYNLWSGQSSKLQYTITGLESESTYTLRVRAENEFVGHSSDPLSVKTSAPEPSFPWLFVVIGCLATLFLIGCMIAVFVLMTRRASRTAYKNVKTKEEVVVNNVPQSKPVHVVDLKQYCNEHHANSDFLFHEEFVSISVPKTNYTFEHSRMPFNQPKNRYSNILPYDHSRVTLNPVDNEVGSSYINANYIDGYKHTKKYIATQGPLPETVLDFWRMIWEQNVSIIVMLTKLVEDNRLKCEQYWPPGEGLQYKNIVVKVLSVSELTDYTIRIFQVYKFNMPNAGQRIVRQYHYTAWPDHGVPSHPTSMLSFVRHVMNYHEIGRLNIEQAKKLDGPIAVHCSAGVGRTGTFIAIEGCLKQIDDEERVDVYGSVYRMRKQRNYMVQTESQYTFIYDALLDNVICGNTEIAPADLVAKVRFLQERDPDTGETNFAAEFKRLESGILQKDAKQFGDANHLENKQKNRFINILPFDKNRVKLMPIAGIRHSDYINASFIDGFQQKNTFIAAQAPLENTVNDFWRMIVEQNVHIIVMLTRLEEKRQDKCYLYWPQASTVSYGKVLVGFIDSIEEESVVIHRLRVTDKESQRSWSVTHFNYLGWPEYGSPDMGTEIIQLIGRVQSTQRNIKNDNGPILVHCSGGVGRTGVFISVFNSIERLKAKDVVDVFQTTRALRLQRTAMVQTIDQYMFCYQALKDYLDSFDLYANTQC